MAMGRLAGAVGNSEYHITCLDTSPVPYLAAGLTPGTVAKEGLFISACYLAVALMHP